MPPARNAPTPPSIGRMPAVPRPAKYRAGPGLRSFGSVCRHVCSHRPAGRWRFGRGGGDFNEFKMRGGDQSYTLIRRFPRSCQGRPEKAVLSGWAHARRECSGRRTETGTVFTFAQSGTARCPVAGPAGDALIEITVEPHALCSSREGNNVVIELPITLTEAVAGGKITVPTIDGPCQHDRTCRFQHRERA